ncbi:hypothetical protein HZA38_04050 [Candidatus Peregrinibacteria bacterium]|nr:hypothetical protein [Candidatus Peregrinibacteria bacterium]
MSKIETQTRGKSAEEHSSVTSERVSSSWINLLRSKFQELFGVDETTKEIVKDVFKRLIDAIRDPLSVLSGRESEVEEILSSKK